MKANSSKYEYQSSCIRGQAAKPCINLTHRRSLLVCPNLDDSLMNWLLVGFGDMSRVSEGSEGLSSALSSDSLNESHCYDFNFLPNSSDTGHRMLGTANEQVRVDLSSQK